MLRTIRPYRRFLIVLGILGSLVLVYNAGFSANSCENGRGDSCYGSQSKKVENIGNVIAPKRKRDLRARFLPVSKDVDVVVNQAVIKEGNDISYKKREKYNYQQKNSKLHLKDHKRIPGGKKSLRESPVTSTKRVVTLSDEIRQHEVRSVYIQLKEADSPKSGDFDCAATIVPDCCAFSVGDTHEAKRICEGFGRLCKGFVMSTISSKRDAFEYVMYLKKELNGTMANYLTDFFIRVDFLDELKWNDKSR